jgi:hypothetical protein
MLLVRSMITLQSTFFSSSVLLALSSGREANEEGGEGRKMRQCCSPGLREAQSRSNPLLFSLDSFIGIFIYRLFKTCN